MAKRYSIPFKHVAARIVGPRHEYLAARVQRLDLPANIPTTDIDELGNPKHAGSVRGITEVTATIQAMDVSIKLFAALTGTDPNNYPAAGVDISNLGDIDIIAVIRDENVADYVKSIHLRKCRCTGFNFSYSVNGEATEEYTFTGTEKRYFKYDVIVETFPAATTSPITLTYTPIQLKNGNYIISFILDGVYYKEVTTTPVAGRGEYRYNAGKIYFADTITKRAVVVYHTNTGSNLWSDVTDNSIPAAVRGKDIPVIIAANNIERVQSVTIRGTLPIDRIEEMGNPNVVGYTTQVPQVTGDITVLDTDLELIALFATGNPNDGSSEFNLCEFTPSGISLEIKIQDPTEACVTSNPTVLKTIYIPEITITSEGHTTNVGGSAQQTFSWRSNTGECIIYSGSR